MPSGDVGISLKKAEAHIGARNSSIKRGIGSCFDDLTT